MTEEKIKKGEELLKEKRWLESQWDKWDMAQRIYRLEICSIGEYDKVNRVLEVDGCFINFEDLKMLAMSRIERRLKEVQEEFDKL